MRHDKPPSCTDKHCALGKGLDKGLDLPEATDVIDHMTRTVPAQISYSHSVPPLVLTNLRIVSATSTSHACTCLCFSFIIAAILRLRASLSVGLFGSMPVDLSLALTYGAIFLSNAFFHSSRVGLTTKRVFLLVVVKGIVTVIPGSCVAVSHTL